MNPKVVAHPTIPDAFLLIDFARNDSRLLPEHQRWLANTAVPRLRTQAQYVGLKGRASRTNRTRDPHHNRDLSVRREAEVERVFTLAGIASDRVVLVEGVGAEESHGGPEENPFWRSVEIRFSTRRPRSRRQQASEGHYFSVIYDVQLHPQPDRHTCWSACATMVLGSNQSVGSGGAMTGPGLSGSGGLRTHAWNVMEFARVHGLEFENLEADHDSRPPIGRLRHLLELYGPLSVDSSFWRGVRHAVVIGGIWGDGTPAGTTMRIYDPWPPGHGRVYDVNLQDFYGTWRPIRYVLHRPARLVSPL